MSECRAITREKLYELVWSMPMRDLARHFDMSDKGLAKKCIRLNVPRPPQGYWLMNHKERNLHKMPLPEYQGSYLEEIIYNPEPQRKVGETPEKPGCMLTDEQLAAAMAFRIRQSVPRYHPLISDARKQARKPSIDKYARLTFGRTVVNPGMKVTPKTFDRACIFLQGLVDLFGTFGWKLTKSSTEMAGFSIGDQTLEFEIKEPVTKIKRSPSSGERPGDRFFWYSHEYVSTGRLEFRITNAYSMNYKKTWYDRGESSIETHLASMAQAFSRGFESRKLDAIKQAEWKRQWEIEQAKREKEARRLKIEKARREQLLSLSEQYQKARAVRDMLQAIESSQSQTGGLATWLEWANTVVDEIDPLCRVDSILKIHREYGSRERFADSYPNGV